MSPVKENSLKKLGYTVEPLQAPQDQQGSQFVYKVTAPPKVFFIKRTQRGKLLAYHNMKDPVDVTIQGLYDFHESRGDLVGRREPLTHRPRHQQQKKQPTSISSQSAA